MGWEGIGSLLGKISNWIPNRREAMQNKIDKIKEELKHVSETKPFDPVRYSRLTNQLFELERKERRAS
jgi:hypothetical protein